VESVPPPGFFSVRFTTKRYRHATPLGQKVFRLPASLKPLQPLPLEEED